jgi:pSer/pThr/pTyr-binding forkhead associated (FHA) protein
MATLEVLHDAAGTISLGRNRTISLERNRTILGREPTCNVHLPRPQVSRKHALILRVGRQFFIEDLQSLNKTFVNDEEVTHQRLLRDKDQIRIYEFRAVFHDAPEPLPTSGQDDNKDLAAELFDSLAGGAEAEGRNRLQMYSAMCLPLEEECRRLRGALEVNHVFCQRAEATALPRQLQERCSVTRQILEQGFHRLVVLNAATGLVPGEREFDLERFLRYAHERMVRAFDLALPDSYHAESVSQILKDEPRSLFCFLNVQHVPVADLRRLRGFTQEVHQVLLLCCGERDLAAEEARRDPHDLDSDAGPIFL